MSEHRFIGREKELQAIRQELDRPRPSIIFINGRRRVGKSRLLVEATADRPTIYYQATKIANSISLDLFRTEAARIAGADPILDSMSDWLGLMIYLEQVATARVPGLTVILDEFPYLCDANPGLPSVFQKFCDGLRDRHSPMNLILCGSKIAFMEDLLAEKNPMHGRQTFKLDVGPLNFRETAQFFPDWTPDEQLRAYGIFGGIPYYLKLCDPKLSLKSNVLDQVLATGAPLGDEPNNLLQAEVRGVSSYATILRAIADGSTDSGTIISRVHDIKDAAALGPYVQKLAELRLIRIVKSLDAEERERNRRYFLDDPFLTFWYRFYLPNASPLVAGHAEDVWNHAIEPRLDDHMELQFERICREYVRLFVREILPTPAGEVGQIWTGDFDIDVAGQLLDRGAFSGECKWWKDLVGLNVLTRLQEISGKTRYFTQAPDFYLLFARSGFTQELQQRLGADVRLRLLGPDQLLGASVK